MKKKKQFITTAWLKTGIRNSFASKIVTKNNSLFPALNSTYGRESPNWLCLLGKVSTQALIFIPPTALLLWLNLHCHFRFVLGHFLGKVVPRAGSNHRHADFQSAVYQLSYLGDATREPRQAFGLYVITGALSRCAGAPETGEIQIREAFRLRLHMGHMTCLMVLIGKGFKSSVKGCCQLLFDLCRFVCSYL